jgi:transposase
MTTVVLEVDLGMNVCSVVAMDGGGRVLVRRRLKRPAVSIFARQCPGCVVAIEACRRAHSQGRRLAAQGHEIRLMLPEYVRSYVKPQKTTTATPGRSQRHRCVPRCALSRSRARSRRTCNGRIGCGSG